MRTVFKYELPALDRCTIRMPEEAEILCVQVQHDKPCIWALVETDNHPYDYEFRVVGTGHDPALEPDQGEYVGTFQLLGGSLVFHVFRI